MRQSNAGKVSVLEWSELEWTEEEEEEVDDEAGRRREDFAEDRREAAAASGIGIKKGLFDRSGKY